MNAFDENFDWVVVGSGGGAMSSALRLLSAGKSVVILEKSLWAGGTTAKSGGVLWLPDNPFMDPGEDSVEQGMAYLDAVVGDGPDMPGTSREKRSAYIREGRRMIDFLVQNGVRLRRGSRFWPDYYDELPGGCKTSRTIVAEPFDKNELREWAPRLRKGFLEVPALLDEGVQVPFMPLGRKLSFFARTGAKIVAGLLTGKRWVTAGAALQGRMLQRVLRSGADVRLECPVSEIIVDDGRALGVVTTRNGKPWRIGAALGVLVNAGGFAKNQQMRDRYMPGTRSEWSMAVESDSGDMHRELERLGAPLAQMDQMVGFQMTRAPGWQDDYLAPSAQSITARPHAILVDQSGQRYLNEGGSYEAYCEAMLQRDRTTPAIPSWAVFDRQFIDLYPLANGGAGKIPRKWREMGYLKQADTIEGLATLIGADPVVLARTIERWNAQVDQGHDDDFQRGAREYDGYLGDPRREGPYRSLGRIDRPPFYAVDIVPGDVSTYGGVVTDALARVLRADGSPIEGLYACGVSTASVMGKVYPGAGASVGPSMVFGWIAAGHAAGLP